MPMPIQKIETIVKTKILRLTKEASTSVVNKIKALYKKTIGSPTMNFKPPNMPAVVNLPSVSIIKFRAIAHIPAKTKLFL